MGFVRKYLSADGLMQTVRTELAKVKWPTIDRAKYSWTDCVLSALAVFGLKLPSLLQFEALKSQDPTLRQNLKNLYGVQNVPSDTCMRERLDLLSPRSLRQPFKRIFAHLQRGKVLEPYRYLDGHYIISIDGTGQYESEKVHCQNCCVKNRRGGKVSYYHQMLGAVLVHPEHKQVIPLAPEPISKADGQSKNDCERNAAKRLLLDLRREHPYLKVLIVEDGLGSNFPHLSLLDELRMNYVIGVKAGDHEYLFDWTRNLNPHTYQVEEKNGTQHHFHWYTDVPLNDSHDHYRVNVLDYWETKGSGKNKKQQHFSWVTKLPLSESNVMQVMRAGRSRWRIENQTFNTLKNQGYHFEHNYGHGYQNLCSVLTMLMMLAFLIDQVKQLCCKLYQEARKARGILTNLFEMVRVSVVNLNVWASWHDLYAFVVAPRSRPPPGTPGGLSLEVG